MSIVKKLISIAILILLCQSYGYAASKGYVKATAPTTCTVGDFWINTSGTLGNRFYTCTSTNTWTLNIGSGGADNLGTATSSDIIALFGGGSCSGYLKSDGTCGSTSASGDDLGSATAANVAALFSGSGDLLGSDGSKKSTSIITSSIVAGLFTGSSGALCYDGTAGNCGISGGASVSDTAYGSSWNGDTTTAPSKNAVYDKIEALSVGSVPFVSDTTPPSSAGAMNYSTSDYRLRARHSNGDVYYSAAFTLETAADTTPNTITYTDVTGAATSQEYTDCQQVTGINWPAAVSTSGGTAAICTSATYATDCGTFGTSPGNVSNNGYVCARITSSSSASTAVNNVVTVGGGGDTFTVTTAGGSSCETVHASLETNSETVHIFATTRIRGDDIAATSGQQICAVQVYVVDVQGGTRTLYLRMGTSADLSSSYTAGSVTVTSANNNSWVTIPLASDVSGSTTYYFGIGTDSSDWDSRVSFGGAPTDCYSSTTGWSLETSDGATINYRVMRR